MSLTAIGLARSFGRDVHFERPTFAAGAALLCGGVEWGMASVAQGGAMDIYCHNGRWLGRALPIQASNPTRTGVVDDHK